MLVSKCYEILTGNLFGKNIVSKLLSIGILARIVLRLNLLLKLFLLSIGSHSTFQRVIEIPWVLTNIKIINPRSLILDIGCSESLLSHELIANGFGVVGLDIRDYPFKNRRMLFMKRDIRDTRIPDETFDAIIVVSTIEHIGLNTYGQSLLDDDGDIKAMEEMYRILKRGGIIILTTPYLGNSPFRIVKVDPMERNYDIHRLKKLIEHFQIVKEEYFYPKRVGRRFHWIQMHKEESIQQYESGLACLILKKS